jgi:PAS domain-containing protein
MVGNGNAEWHYFCSENKVRMLGYDPAKHKFVHYSDFTKLVHPDDYEVCMQAMRDLFSGKKDKYEAVYRIKCKDGTYKTFYDRGKISGRRGEEFVVTGLVMDEDYSKASIDLVD